MDKQINKYTDFGLPANKSYLTKNLPEFLQKDIDSYLLGIEKNSSLLDCLWCELYSSINVAENGNNISSEQAKYLREIHLDI